MTGKADLSFFALIAWGMFIVVAFFGFHLATVTEAGAVSLRVKLACRDDYFTHCSMFSPGSTETRQCMRKIGKNLSTRCLAALVEAGEAPPRALASRR